MKVKGPKGFSVRTSPGRIVNGVWQVPIAVRLTRRTKVRFWIAGRLLRLTALALPEVARKHLADRLGEAQR